MATEGPARRFEAPVVVTADAAGRVLAPGALEVAGDRIRWVGDPAERPAGDAEVVRLPGLLMPGLVNCHAHSPMTLLRGVGEGLGLDRWLADAIWPREAHLEGDDVYFGMLLACREMLGCGVTTSCETYFHDHRVADAAVEAGLRCLVTPGILDLPGAGPGRSWRAMLDAALDLHQTMDGRAGLITVGLGPHAAYSVPSAGLEAVAEAAAGIGALVHLHLAETAGEGDAIRAETGLSVPFYLERCGLLDGPVLAAHGVWLSDEDLDLLAERGVAVAHCPQSNAKLGSGVARLTDMLARGVTVGLGTDGPASNNDLDLWEEMRLAPLLARAVARQPTAVPVAQALDLATRQGGAALRLEVGALEAGRLADLVHLRLDHTRFVPVVTGDDLLAHLVWSSASHLVSDVWVGGTAVVRDGTCLTVDEQAVMAEVQARAERLHAAVS